MFKTTTERSFTITSVNYTAQGVIHHSSMWFEIRVAVEIMMAAAIMCRPCDHTPEINREGWTTNTCIDRSSDKMRKLNSEDIESVVFTCNLSRLSFSQNEESYRHTLPRMLGHKQNIMGIERCPVITINSTEDKCGLKTKLLKRRLPLPQSSHYCNTAVRNTIQFKSNYNVEWVNARVREREKCAAS